MKKIFLLPYPYLSIANLSLYKSYYYNKNNQFILPVSQHHGILLEDDAIYTYRMPNNLFSMSYFLQTIRGTNTYKYIIKRVMY